MPFLDFAFRLQGSTIPADHSFFLYSALSRALPALHPPGSLSAMVGVHGIRGRLIGNRQMELTSSSRLTLRLPSAKIDEVLPLVGKALHIGPQPLQIGTPEILPLRETACLYSRLVTLKGHTDSEPFLAAVKRDLEKLGIRGRAGIPLRKSDHSVESRKGSGEREPLLRRTIQIQGKQVVGFALQLSELTAEESIIIQEKGIGGRRHFGCGIFIPASS